jgi:hypothetical protein
VAPPPSSDQNEEPKDDTFGGEHIAIDYITDSSPPSAPTRNADPAKEDPIERFKKAKAMSDEHEGDGYGQGEDGYKAPRGVNDKLKNRKTLPYKVLSLIPFGNSSYVNADAPGTLAVQVPSCLGRLLSCHHRY